MATGTAEPATRAQVAMYGHIAAALRAVMKARGWGPYDLNVAIGRERGHASVYQWLNSKGAPGPMLRPIVAKATGIPEAELMARKLGMATAAVLADHRVPARITAPSVRTTDALVFRVTASGEAQIKLDVTLPLAAATPLLRMLLDAGIVFGAEGEQ